MGKTYLDIIKKVIFLYKNYEEERNCYGGGNIIEINSAEVMEEVLNRLYSPAYIALCNYMENFDIETVAFLKTIMNIGVDSEILTGNPEDIFNNYYNKIYVSDLKGDIEYLKEHNLGKHLVEGLRILKINT